MHGCLPTVPSLVPHAPVIDALMVDNLVKDFDLEPGQRANLHAFVQVCLASSINTSPLIGDTIQIGLADGLLGKSDLLTRLYMLIALYSEAAQKRRTAQSQGFENIRELFEDLKTRLEGNFVLTKQQSVQHFYLCSRIVLLLTV